MSQEIEVLFRQFQRSEQGGSAYPDQYRLLLFRAVHARVTLEARLKTLQFTIARLHAERDKDRLIIESLRESVLQLQQTKKQYSINCVLLSRKQTALIDLQAKFANLRNEFGQLLSLNKESLTQNQRLVAEVKQGQQLNTALRTQVLQYQELQEANSLQLLRLKSLCQQQKGQMDLLRDNEYKSRDQINKVREQVEQLVIKLERQNQTLVEQRQNLNLAQLEKKKVDDNCSHLLLRVASLEEEVERCKRELEKECDYRANQTQLLRQLQQSHKQAVRQSKVQEEQARRLVLQLQQSVQALKQKDSITQSALSQADKQIASSRTALQLQRNNFRRDLEELEARNKQAVLKLSADFKAQLQEESALRKEELAQSRAKAEQQTKALLLDHETAVSGLQGELDRLRRQTRQKEQQWESAEVEFQAIRERSKSLVKANAELLLQTEQLRASRDKMLRLLESKDRLLRKREERLGQLLEI